MIALCFLVYDTVQHENIWEDFLSDPYADNFNVYAHIKDVNSKTPKWLKKNKVRTIKTDWCGDNLVFAFIQMLREALKDKNNRFFVLLSGTCIPLHNTETTYDMIVSDPRSKINYEKIYSTEFYKASQWVILNRENARDVIRLRDRSDKEAKKYLSYMRATEDQHDYYHGGGCADETYIINWLIHLNKLSELLRYGTTYTAWSDRDMNHPIIFNKRNILNHEDNMRRERCIFARKFKDELGTYMNRQNKRIVVKKELAGRLGNQMFNYASSLGIAKKRGGIACIIENESMDDQNCLIYMFNGPFDICSDKRYTSKYSKYFPCKIVEEEGYAKYDKTLERGNGCITIYTDDMNGFLQSYKYFQNDRNEILDIFSFSKNINKSTDRYLSKFGKVCVIHIRGGDHIDLKYLRFPPRKYFDKAMDYFRKLYGSVSFLVISNDRKWVDEYFAGYDDVFNITHTKTPAEDLCIARKSDGVIMSIGTFSWWAAYLSEGPTIYYGREFDMDHPINKGNVRVKDFYPPSWIKM